MISKMNKKRGSPLFFNEKILKIQYQESGKCMASELIRVPQLLGNTRRRRKGTKMGVLRYTKKQKRET